MKLSEAIAATCLATATALLPAASEAAQYGFTLTPDHDQPSNFVGSGYVDVNTEALPESGSGSLQLSFIAFSLAGSKFGTAIGSYSVEGTLQDHHIVPEGTFPGSVLFQDFQPVGVIYYEEHLCHFTYHCGPAEQVSLSGDTFNAFIYPAGQIYPPPLGTLAFTEAVPEPAAYALLLSGALAVIWASRRKQSKMPRRRTMSR